MKSFILICCLVSLLLFPLVAFCVSFDFWETGMSINEVVRVAQEHDIPIARDGIIHGSKQFNQKLIDDNFYKASTVYYRTDLSGRNATIYLRFTDDPKFIREIDVKFYGINDRDPFTREMLGVLSGKYGSYRESKELFSKSYVWIPDPYSQILMRVGSGEVSIIYTDLKIKKDFEDQRRKREIESIKKDAGKY